MNSKNISIIFALALILFASAPKACAHTSSFKLSNWSSMGTSPEPNGYLMTAVDSVVGESGKVAMIKSSHAAQPGCFQALFVNCDGRNFAN